MRKRTHRPHKPAVKVVVAALALIALLAAAVYALGASSRGSFTIRGNTAARLLTPGVAAPVDVRLTNTHGFTLEIADLSVRLAGIDAPEADAAHLCTAEDFAIVQFSGDEDLHLPASSTHDLRSLGVPVADWPRVMMVDRPVNQDGCKRASLRLSFTADSSPGHS